MYNSVLTRDGVQPEPLATSEPRVSILLVDDHAILRDALAALLNDIGDFEVVGTAGSVEEALEILERADPSVIVLDMSMPGRSGLDMFTELDRRNSRARVLVLSMHAGEGYVVSALNAGAAGYVCKDVSSAQLAKALRAVAAGRMFLCVDGVDDAAMQSTHAGNQFEDGLLSTITVRERAVLRSLALGHCNKRIAQELGISIKTVEKHRCNLMRKIHVHNAAGLTLFAARRGIVSAREDNASDDARQACEGMSRRQPVAAA